MKKISAVFLVFILLSTAGCLEKGPDEPVTGDGNTSSQYDDGDGGITSNLPYAAEGETEPEAEGPGLLDMYVIKRAAEQYAKSANMVKTEGAGFTLSEWQEVKNIKTSVADALINRVMDVLGPRFITDRDKEFNETAEYIERGDSGKINNRIPVRGRDYACILEEDFGCIDSADYINTGDKIEIVLNFKDALNVEEDAPGLGQFMTPFDMNDAYEAVKYVFFIKSDTFIVNVLYRGCYIKCVIDSQTERMISMEQHVISYFAVSAGTRFLGLRGDFTANVTVENHGYYYDFVW